MQEAMLFSFCLGDGWISKSKQSNHNSYYYQVGFSGDLESLKERVKPDLIDLYGDIGKATIRTGRMTSEKYGIDGITSQFIANTRVAKRFIDLGLVSGKKVETEYEIPKWVRNGSTETKKGFLSGFYSAEGFTPAFQKNNKTLKPLGFRFFKRIEQTQNKDLLVEQWSSLLNDVGIKFSYEETRRTTVSENYVCTFIFSNEHDQIVHQLSLLDLRYSKDKQDMKNNVLLYYRAKEKSIKNMTEANRFALDNLHVSAYEISKMFGINRNTVYSWRRRKTAIRLPNNFVTFNQFVLSL